MNESEAISRLKHGDISGLEVLVRQYQAKAVWAAYMVSRDRSTAEDIVGTAFVHVYERIHRFDSQRPFGPWFLRMVVNDAIKSVAREKRHVSLEHPPREEQAALADRLVDLSSGPEELSEKAEVRRALWEALGKLSPPQRAVIVLRYYLGLKDTEIAGQLGRAPGTVKKHLHDARKRLRSLLEDLRPGLAGKDFPPRATREVPRSTTSAPGTERVEGK